jgi:hypothetical protein
MPRGIDVEADVMGTRVRIAVNGAGARPEPMRPRADVPARGDALPAAPRVAFRVLPRPERAAASPD